MYYLISFFEGIITFISPCLLPMLPVYIAYFSAGEEKGKQTVWNAIGFVLGFGILFTTMGAFAGSIGSFLQEHKNLLNVITGGIVIFFGLNFLGILKIEIFNNIHRNSMNQKNGFFASVIFGVVFSVGWTPCVGAFLGSALMMAAERGSVIQGILMLAAYSLGLGIPFVLSAVLIERLKGTLQFVKRHYEIINRAAGIFLLLIGLLMMTGYMGKLLSLLSF